MAACFVANSLMHHRIISFFKLLVYQCLLFLTSCGVARNYSEQEMPKFEDTLANTPSSSSETLKMVSFNVQYGNDIEKVIFEFQNRPQLQDADIIMLQEMDDVGTRQIAEALQLNYVYYPAVVHPHNGKNFGNAILSKWPISGSGKLLLPHQHPINKQQRIAVFAIVTVNKQPIAVYNIHIEVPLLSTAKRLEQIDTALRHAARQPVPFSIIGGDLNAVGADVRISFSSLFHEYGFDWATANVGATSKFLMQLDQLYVKGMSVIEAGAESEIKIGDHYPVWAVVKPYRVVDWY